MGRVLKVLNRISYALHWVMMITSILITIDKFKVGSTGLGITYLILSIVWGMIAGVETVFITSKDYDF